MVSRRMTKAMRACGCGASWERCVGEGGLVIVIFSAMGLVVIFPLISAGRDLVLSSPPTNCSFRELRIASLVAGDHDSGTCAFTLGQLASGSPAHFPPFRFPANNRAIGVPLAQCVLQAAAPRTPAMARRQIRTGTAGLWRSARFHEGQCLYDLGTQRSQQRKGLARARPI